MSPIVPPTISSPGRCVLPLIRRDSDTLRYAASHTSATTSDNRQPTRGLSIDQYSQHGTSPGAILPAYSDELSPAPFQTPVRQTVEQQSHSSFNNNPVSTSSLPFSRLHSYVEIILALPLLRHLRKLFIAIQSLLPRFYYGRFNYAKASSTRSAAERGLIGQVALWEEQVQGIMLGYMTIATGSSGAFSVIVTILQLQATTSNPYVTTLIVSAILFIINAIACSVMFIAYNAAILSPDVAVAWSEATNASAPLWQLLALPLHFVLLAALFTCAAMFVLAWSNIGNTGAGGPPTPTGPPPTLPVSGGVSSAPPVSALVQGPDISLLVRRASTALIIAYGIYRIYCARAELLAMARRYTVRTAAHRANGAAPAVEGPVVGQRS